MQLRSQEQKYEAIRMFPYFDGISERALKPLGDYLIKKDLERGDQVWREGAKACNFTFIVEGQVKIVKQRADSKEVILGLFTGGDPIGHIAVFEEMKYPASAVAVDDTTLLQIHRDHFLGTLRREPCLMEAVLKNMMARNFDLVRRLHDVTVSAAEQRLALLFDKMAYSSGVRTKLEDGSMGVSVPMALSRSDLAQLINTRVETAIRLMSKWRDAELVRTDDNGFTILKPDEIREIANPAGAISASEVV